jgi:hypothetical protein
MIIHTTLYDLIAALNAAIGPDEEDVLTATVVHLLNTYRIICTGKLQGYRLRAFMSREYIARNSDGSQNGMRSR